MNASLTNVGTEFVEVSYGPTLLLTDNSADDDLAWADDLVIDPETHVGPWDEPRRTDTGCWRFPADGSTLYQGSLEQRGLDPDESITETFSIYTRGDSLPCLPEGTYRFQDKGYVTDYGYMFLTSNLEIDDEGRVVASGHADVEQASTETKPSTV